MEVRRVLFRSDLRGLGHHVQLDRGLARALGAVDLDDAPARQSTDAEANVEAEGAGGDHFRLDHLIGTELHDRALAKGAFDLPQGRFQRLLRSEEHTSELQSLMRISYAVFCLNKKNTQSNK